MEEGKKCELSGLYLYSEIDENGNKYYYLRAHYDVEDEFRKTEVIYPKICLPVITNNLPVAKQEYLYTHCRRTLSDPFINIGFGDTPCMRNSLNNAYVYEIVKEEKTRKMTLAEIEAKLGHKIEIIK